MSKGSPFISVRIPQHLLEKIDAYIALKNTRRRLEEWSRASYVLDAILEKIAKQERSRLSRKTKSKRAQRLAKLWQESR